MKEIILNKGEQILIKGQSSVCIVAVNVDGEIYSKTDYKRLEEQPTGDKK